MADAEADSWMIEDIAAHLRVKPKAADIYR